MPMGENASDGSGSPPSFADDIINDIFYHQAPQVPEWRRRLTSVFIDENVLPGVDQGSITTADVNPVPSFAEWCSQKSQSCANSSTMVPQKRSLPCKPNSPAEKEAQVRTLSSLKK